MKIKSADWTLEEITRLQKLQKLYKREWSIITKEINKDFNRNRTSAQCRYHFNKINKEWKQKDIELLIFKRLQGTEWSEIMSLFPGRKEEQLKAKYNQLINTEAFERINQQLNSQYQQDNVKTIEIALAVEEIPSFKFKHWQTTYLPNFDIMTSKRKIILNDFKV